MLRYSLMVMSTARAFHGSRLKDDSRGPSGLNHPCAGDTWEQQEWLGKMWTLGSSQLRGFLVRQPVEVHRVDPAFRLPHLPKTSDSPVFPIFLLLLYCQSLSPQETYLSAAFQVQKRDRHKDLSTAALSHTEPVRNEKVPSSLHEGVFLG